MRHLWITPCFAAVAAATVPSVWAQEPNFGRALTMTSTELVVGQPVNWYGPGVVYTYRLGPSGAWREHSRLTASDSSRMDDFGRALAMDGNTLVVGAPRKRGTSGIAYVFRRASARGAWRQTGIIEPPRSGNHAEYASALVLSGNDMLIASPAADSTGVIYHFRRTGDRWRQHAVIRPEGGVGIRGFGRAISQHGDGLLIGAPTADSGAGRVFVARRDASGNWGSPSSVSIPRVPGPPARFGSAVLLRGDKAYVGSPGARSVGVLAPDAAGTWALVSTLVAADSARGTQFGFSLAAVGDEVWVGAPGTNEFNGRVHRFAPNGAGGWRAEQLDTDSATGSSWPFAFGYSIASSGDRAVVAMPSRDFGEGRVLAVAKAGDVWRPRQTLSGRIYTIGSEVTPGAKCRDGKIGEFTCSNMELVAHMPVSALGGERGVWLNDVWGWTDAQTGKDYALVARRDGMSFVDVSNPSGPKLVGNLPRTRGVPPSVWRSIKVMNDHAYIVADGAHAHGMQVFDLARLRRANAATGAAPVTFEPDTTYRNVHSAHNVVADTSSGFLFIVGANGGGETCGGGLHMVDARHPTRLVFAGCYNDRAGSNPRGYTHDAQCILYRGPDARHRGRQICIASNESEINIADVTDKAKPVMIGRNSYPNVSYAHQGWFDEEQRYFYMNDEGDELEGKVAGTRTIVWDLAKLDDPIVAYEYIGPVKASDHNLFVKGNRVYEANYGSGLRVLDITDRTKPREIGFFDSAPLNDDGPGYSAQQSGAWSNYPFFKSGIVVFTSVREGLFIVKVVDGVPIS